jgi:hypothetical protein
LISWLRVSLAVWRCRGELEPVLATAGADYARHIGGGTSRAFVLPEPL